MRLAKYMAKLGIGSLRSSERMIMDGRVCIDGELVQNVVTFVEPGQSITVDGVRYVDKSRDIRLWMLYKPRGVLTSNSDPRGRKLVFDIVPKIPNERLLCIGRLDYNSEGLLLMTNNGMLARFMELPSSALRRIYHVKVYGSLPKDFCLCIKNGICIEGICYRSIVCNILKQKHKQTWLRFELREGKNREIRKIVEHFSCVVTRLIRIGYADFDLSPDVRPGDFFEVPSTIVYNFIEKHGVIL